MKQARNHYASIWCRAGALLTDVALIMAMTVFALFVWSTMLNENLELNRLFSLPVLAGAGTIYFLLSVILDSRLQGTPGLKIMDCCLQDSKTGNSISLGQSLARNLAWPLSVLPVMFGVLWMIFDRRAQMFHDKLAGTVVVIDDTARLRLDELSGKPR